MEKTPLKVAVTGGAGQISYSILFRIASGEMFGHDQPIILHILELEVAMDSLKGVKMELDDCAFPLLKKVFLSSKATEVFEDVDYALFIGSKPRGPGMERKDLLSENGKIFVEQGKALNQSAKKSVISLVVGNPCNTNCLVLAHNAKDIPKKQFHAMTRLDQNRAQYQLAAKANVELSSVKNVIIWGNHSATQVPDFVHATINGKPAADVIKDKTWLKETFFSTIQKRGAEVIKTRGKSSAASAANAALNAIQSIYGTNKDDSIFSSCVWSEDNPYHIDPELFFSFPCKLLKSGVVDIYHEMKWDNFLEEKIAITENELKDERDAVAHLLK